MSYGLPGHWKQLQLSDPRWVELNFIGSLSTGTDPAPRKVKLIFVVRDDGQSPRSKRFQMWYTVVRTVTHGLVNPASASISLDNRRAHGHHKTDILHFPTSKIFLPAFIPFLRALLYLFVIRRRTWTRNRSSMPGQTSSAVHQVVLSPGLKRRGVKITTWHHIVPTFRMRLAISAFLRLPSCRGT